MTEQLKDSSSLAVTRRRLLAACSAAGLGQTLFPGALLAVLSTDAEAQRRETPADPAADKRLSDQIDVVAEMTGIKITEDQKKMMLPGLRSQHEAVVAIRELKLPNSVAPAFVFDPVPPGMMLDTAKKPMKISAAPKVAFEKTQASAGDDLSVSNPLAFLTVRELAELVRTRKVSSMELTKMYLARLRKLDPKLHFVITYTEERALKQAAAADAEIAAGKYRGPLHGIPWGGKDLLAVKGYPTTWGAAGFEKQTFDEDAVVVQRLDAAGAVLIAKMSMGALAQGDVWFGARTRNPWNPTQGSSGSSAGSGSAAAAGCVGFAIGTETLGSISSPATRNGATGLRPTFGFVPRTGAMALSWTMDKIGPICRSVEDCAIVLSAIYGQDGKDLSVQPAAFNWDANFDWKKLRVGYLKSAFDDEPLAADATPQQKAMHDRRAYDAKYATAAIATLRKMGVDLIPVEMPKFPFQAITPVLQAEAAAAFDELTLTGRADLLTGQGPGDWPNHVPRGTLLFSRRLHSGHARADAGDRRDGEAFRDGGCDRDAVAGRAAYGDESHRASGGHRAQRRARRGCSGSPGGSGGRAAEHWRAEHACVADVPGPTLYRCPRCGVGARVPGGDRLSQTASEADLQLEGRTEVQPQIPPLRCGMTTKACRAGPRAHPMWRTVISRTRKFAGVLQAYTMAPATSAASIMCESRM